MAAPKIPPKALRDLWAKVPEMKGCDGRCAVSCGPVPASTLERELIEDRAGEPLTTTEDLTCSMLRNGRCTVYSIRPLICRIWGTTREMPCVFGCEPERYLSREESRELMEEIARVGGESAVNLMENMMATMTPAQQREWEVATGFTQADIQRLPGGLDGPP